jgi:hypothetical protein
MGFLPLSYWGNNTGTIVPNGIVFYLAPTSFTGTGQWLDVSGNNNHASVSGSAMGNDATGWMFNGGQFSTGSNSLIWSSSLAQQPSSSFTLQWYGKFKVEGAPNYNSRYFWRTTNLSQDLSGSGWSTDYAVDYIDVLSYSGSTNTGGGQIGYPIPASYFDGTTPVVFSLTFNNGTQSLYINDNIVAQGTQTAPIFEFTGSTSGQPYPLTFGKAPLHVRCDYYSAGNGSGQSTTWGYIDKNHNYQEGTSSPGNDFTAEVWPSTTMYKVSGFNPSSTSNALNLGSIPTSSLLEPLINQSIYGIGVSGSVNSLLLYNRVLSAGEISNNARILTGTPALTPNILPTPQPPTAVTQSATNLSLSLDAKNGFWYNQPTWYDISGNGNNLTLSGSCTYDPITGSVGFDGNFANYFARTSNTNGLNLSTNASVEVWLKWWGGDDNYYRNAFSLGKSTAGPLSGSYVSVLFGDNGYSDGLEGRWGPATNSYYVPAFGSAHNYTKQNSNNIWRQCVLVKTGTTVDYYVNGAFEDTRTISGSVSGSIIMVGGITPQGSPTNQFIGEVGIVKVWNGTSLTATDISASFASNRSRFGI